MTAEDAAVEARAATTTPRAWLPTSGPELIAVLRTAVREECAARG